MPKTWKVAIVKDTARPMLGLHGLHVAFRGLPQAEVVALADSNPDGVAARLAATGARRHYADAVAMLDRERPDITVICSRHPSDHLPLICAAAERGIHVYCEKPMTASLEEADRIIAMAERHRITVCVAHPGRYAAEFLAMREMIGSGAIGTPHTAHGRGKCDHRGGGEDLIVLGTHILDLQAFLFGAPLRVSAEITAGGGPIRAGDRTATIEPIGPAAGDTVSAAFTFPGGVRGLFHSRRGLLVPGSGRIHMGLTVVGDRGALSLRFNDMLPGSVNLRLSRVPAPPEDDAAYVPVPVQRTVVPGAEPLDYALCGTPDIPVEPFFLEANRNAVLDLMAAISENRQPVSSMYTACTALEMVHGIYAAHLGSRTVSFPLACRSHPLEA